MMKVVTQNGTLSCLSERTINILCSSLHELSHSPGRGVFSGSAEVNQMFQSRGYWSNELAIPMKLASLHWRGGGGGGGGGRERERENNSNHSVHVVRVYHHHGGL